MRALLLPLLALAACQPTAGPPAESAEPDAAVPTETRPAPSAPDTTGLAARADAIDTTVRGGYRVFVAAGTFHDGEAPARDGERWTAVVPTPRGTERRTVPIAVETAPDWVVDAAEGPFTGRRVTSPASVVREDGSVEDPALFFVRRAGGPLAEGPVPTVATDVAVDRAGTIPLAVGGRAYRLEVEAGRAYASGGVARTVTLVGPDGARQPLAHLPDPDSGHLVWAGDLDADGRLDLLLDESGHYNLSAPTLYLSSEAAPGALVARVARHESTGG